MACDRGIRGVEIEHALLVPGWWVEIRDKREEEMTLVARSLPCQIRNITASLPRPHRKVMNCQNETSVLLGLPSVPLHQLSAGLLLG